MLIVPPGVGENAVRFPDTLGRKVPGRPLRTPTEAVRSAIRSDPRAGKVVAREPRSRADGQKPPLGAILPNAGEASQTLVVGAGLRDQHLAAVGKAEAVDRGEEIDAVVVAVPRIGTIQLKLVTINDGRQVDQLLLGRGDNVVGEVHHEAGMVAGDTRP
jgi:hypothetical protein